MSIDSKPIDYQDRSDLSKLQSEKENISTNPVENPLGKVDRQIHEAARKIQSLTPPLSRHTAMPNAVKDIKKRKRKEGASFDDADQDLLFDSYRNSIPAACFEIGATLALLDHPGEGGVHIDLFSKKLSQLLTAIYNTRLGEKRVILHGERKKLKELFDQKLLQNIKPSSNQIGRCTNQYLDATWLDGEGILWLQNELKVSSRDPDYTFENMLTKIRVLSAYGTITNELMRAKPSQIEVLSFLTGNSTQEISNRFATIVLLLRHPRFDHLETRGRSERPPIINGQPLTNRPLQNGDALKVGFGNVYGPKSFSPEEIELQKTYERLVAKNGRDHLERVGQPIKNLERPGNLSEETFERMPDAFRRLGLIDLLEEKAVSHGTGVNRWDLHGTYARESTLSNLPVAGGHSSGAVDILLALDTLSDETICGNQEVVMSTGLLISAFMNFGAYHSFVETFPIAQAFAEAQKFKVCIDQNNERMNPLYDAYTKTACRFSKDGGDKVAAFRQAHIDSLREAKYMKRSISREDPHLV